MKTENPIEKKAQRAASSLIDVMEKLSEVLDDVANIREQANNLISKIDTLEYDLGDHSTERVKDLQTIVNLYRFSSNVAIHTSDDFVAEYAHNTGGKVLREALMSTIAPEKLEDWDDVSSGHKELYITGALGLLTDYASFIRRYLPDDVDRRVKKPRNFQ